MLHKPALVPIYTRGIRKNKKPPIRAPIPSQDCIMPKEPQPFMFGCVKLLHHGIGSLRLSQLPTETEFMWGVRKWKCSRKETMRVCNRIMTPRVLAPTCGAFYPSSWKILEVLVSRMNRRLFARCDQKKIGFLWSGCLLSAPLHSFVAYGCSVLVGCTGYVVAVFDNGVSRKYKPNANLKFCFSSKWFSHFFFSHYC